MEFIFYGTNIMFKMVTYSSKNYRGLKASINNVFESGNSSIMFVTKAVLPLIHFIKSARYFNGNVIISHLNFKS